MSALHEGVSGLGGNGYCYSYWKPADADAAKHGMAGDHRFSLWRFAFGERSNGQDAEATESIPSLACTAQTSSSIRRRGLWPSGFCAYRLFLAVSKTVTVPGNGLV